MEKIVLSLVFSIISLFAFEELNSDNFESKIKGKNVIVDFHAVWCPPCKVLGKNLIEFDKVKPEGVTVYKVNIDEQMPLTKKHGVTKLPTLVYFQDGKLVKTKVGVQSVDELKESSIEVFNLK